MLFLEKCKKVDYERVRQYREPYLRAAFMAFVEQKGYEKPEYKEFVAQSWVYEYGVFRALKKANNGACWNEWPEEDRTCLRTDTYWIQSQRQKQDTRCSFSIFSIPSG